jgi:single-strand DNA-binding protein
MASVNRVILIGNMVRDPALKYLPSQTAVCEFGLACTDKWKDKDGNAKEDTLFIDCAIFGKGAEVFQQYVQKGHSVYVEGKLKLSVWGDRQGAGKRSKISMIVEGFQFLNNRKDDGSGGGGNTNQPKGGNQQRPPAGNQNRGSGNRAPQSQPEPEGGSFDESEIPFAHHPPIC